MNFWSSLICFGVIVTCVSGCVPARPIKDIIWQHSHQRSGGIGAANPVPIDLSEKEIIEGILGGGSFKSRANSSSSGAIFKKAASGFREATGNSSVISEDASLNETATATFKPNTLDDPNFIPGSFLDSDGNTEFINPPSVTDVLTDFLSRIEKHKSEFGAAAAVLIVNVASQMLNIIGLIWVVGLTLPLFRQIWKMKARLPKSRTDKMVEAQELAHLYMSKPEAFTALIAPQKTDKTPTAKTVHKHKEKNEGPSSPLKEDLVSSTKKRKPEKTEREGKDDVTSPISTSDIKE